MLCISHFNEHKVWHNFMDTINLVYCVVLNQKQQPHVLRTISSPEIRPLKQCTCYEANFKNFSEEQVINVLLYNSYLVKTKKFQVKQLNFF